MYGYIYKVSINNPESILHGCYYIGQHKYKTRNKSKYYGSGILIKQYINKYKDFGLKKEILFECKDENELNEKEKEFVGDLFLTDCFADGGKCLNLKGGGDYAKFSEATRKKISKALKGNTNYLINGRPWNTNMKMSKEFCDKVAKRNIGNSYHLGKKHSEDTKKKLSENQKSNRWWNNGEKEIHTKTCPEGFVAGRITKPSEEFKKTNSERKKQCKWWTNGSIDKFCEECPEGFKSGRSKFVIKRKNIEP